MQSTRRWLNQSHPQTLLIATWLLYANAVFAALDLIRIGNWRLLSTVGILYFVVRIAGGVIAGRGIANDQKRGYYLGFVVALAPFLFRASLSGNPLDADILTLAFEIALVLLLAHPMSREYQKVWFK